MKPHNWTYLLIALLFSCSLPSEETFQVEKGEVDLSGHNFKHYGKVDLVGDVPYYPDQLLSASEINSGKYQPVYVNLSQELSSQIPSGDAKGVGTYHLKVKLPDDEHSYGIFVKGIFTSYKLFIGDKFEDGMGVVSEDPKVQKPMVRPEIIALPLEKGFNDVIIQVANFHDNKTHINFDLEIGEMHGLYADQHIMYNYDFGFSFFYGLVGITFLVMTYFNRKKLFILFGCYSLIIAFRFLIKDSKFLLELVDSHWVLFYKAEFVTYYYSAVLVPIILGRMLYVIKSGWINMVLFLIATTASILTLVFPVPVFADYVVIYHYISIGLIFLCGVLAVMHIINSKRKHLGLVLATMLFASFFLYDIVMSLIYYAESYYYNWGLTMLTFIMAIDLIFYQLFPRKKWNVL